jgi:hypothetical protein
MRFRDKDGNVGEVGEVLHEDLAGRSRGRLIGICADGLWLTPAQALRFAAAISTMAHRVRKKRLKRRGRSR